MTVEEKIILLVDDDPADVKLAQVALKRFNIANEVVVASDGVEAMDYLFGTGQFQGRDIQNLPAVTLLDLKMPRMDGLEVLRRIRAKPLTKFLPVVIMTSSKEEKDIVKSYEIGCNSYICKPVDFDNFSEAIRQLGLYWLVLNEVPPVRK